MQDLTKARKANIPAELQELRQWVAWRFVPDSDPDKKPKKKPINSANGNPASVRDPSTWGTLNEAIACCAHHKLDGAGFVFTDDDDFVGIDLDDCRNPETGEIAPWAREILHDLSSYSEISPSGTGIHIIARGKLPGCGRRFRDGATSIETYDDGHFFAMTGHRLNAPHYHHIKEREKKVTALYQRISGKSKRTHTEDDGLERPAGLADNELLEKARLGSNGAKFELLWVGDWEEAGYSSQSEGDLALCSFLAQYAGNNAMHIDRLFRKSGLYRSKWDEKNHSSDGRTYGEMTLARTIGASSSVATSLVSFAQIEPQKVKWLWPYHIPLGKITLLEGDPDLGKSALSLDFAARVTRGRCMPDGMRGAKGDVILVTAEDAADDTIRPRLDSAGADVSRVHLVRIADGHVFTIPSDLGELRSHIVKTKAKLVVIDPLAAFLAPKIDSYTAVAFANLNWPLLII